MKNQHFRFLAPTSPHIYPSHLPPKLFRLHFSLSDQLFSWIFWKCTPRCCRKHNSKYRQKAFLIKNITFWTSKRPKSSPFWWWFSALSLCCSLLCPFIPSMSPKLNLEKRRIRVYYCCRWLPWPTLMIYPTSFWRHLHVSNPILVVFWCIRHNFGSIFHFPVSLFHELSENVLPAYVGSTILNIATTHF